jgi:hypothetical protein
MSMHKTPLTPAEESGLRAHGLDIGTPSQLSDAFRQGVAWGQKTAREACAKECEAKVDAERQHLAEENSRSAESDESSRWWLRHWSDVLLWNRAHEQMAAAIRAHSNAELCGPREAD